MILNKGLRKLVRVTLSKISADRLGFKLNVCVSVYFYSLLMMFWLNENWLKKVLKTAFDVQIFFRIYRVTSLIVLNSCRFLVPFNF